MDRFTDASCVRSSMRLSIRFSFVHSNFNKNSQTLLHNKNDLTLNETRTKIARQHKLSLWRISSFCRWWPMYYQVVGKKKVKKVKSSTCY